MLKVRMELSSGFEQIMSLDTGGLVVNASVTLTRPCVLNSAAHTSASEFQRSKGRLGPADERLVMCWKRALHVGPLI